MKSYKKGRIIYVILIIIVAICIAMIRTSNIGLNKKELTYIETLDLIANRSSEYNITINYPGIVKSIKLVGSVSLDGSAKVYVNYEKRPYLIFDSEELKKQKFLSDDDFIKKYDKDKAKLGTGNINLEYYSKSQHDIDNNGEETTEGIIDLTVANTLFDFKPDYNKLCTVWFVESLDSISSLKGCYGNKDCCNFVNLESFGEWNQTFQLNYGSLGATYNNIVSAQIIHYNSDITYSSLANITAKFYPTQIKFHNFCLETCSVDNFEKDSYEIKTEIDNATLNLHSIQFLMEN